MSIVIKSRLDTTGIKEGTSAAQGALKEDISQSLSQVQAKASEAEKTLKGMFDLGKIQAAAGAFGALKGILEKSGVAALGLSEETNKAVTSTLDLAAQGVSVGAAFGPIGALVGGVTGALLGYVTATKDATEATAELAKAEKQRQEQLKFDALVLDKAATLSERFAATQQKAALALNSDEFGLAGKNLSDLTDAYLDANDKIKYFAERAKDAQAIVDGLTGSQSANTALVEIQENALENYNKQMDEAIRKQQAAQGQIDALTSSTKNLTKATKEVSEVTVGVKGPTITTDVDKLKKAAQDRRTIEDERLVEEQERLQEFEQSYQAHEERVAENRMRLVQEAAEAQKQAIEEVQKQIEESSKRMSEAMKNTFITVGVGAAKTFFDNIEAGKKPLEGMGKAFAVLASEQLKALGTTLVGEGIANELKAAALLIGSLGALSGPAAALAGVGAGQIGLGLAMGAGGALLGRRANRGGGDATSTGGSESLGAREQEASGPRELAPVKIYLGPENGMAVFSDDRRGLSKYGEFTATAMELSRKAPR